MNMRHTVRKLAWNFGIDISRFTNSFHPIWQRRRLLNLKNITCVLDVGANTGGFAQHMRRDVGYHGKMVSFEPLSEAFRELRRAAAGDRSWKAVNFALGDQDTEAEINVAGNSASSSLLDMLPRHAHAAPASVYCRREKIVIRRLDSIYREYCDERDAIYLKIDTQGFESRVLSGARDALRQVAVIQLELSVVPLYDGEKIATEMISWLQSQGFLLCHLEPVFKDKATEALLQMDGLFFRA